MQQVVAVIENLALPALIDRAATALSSARTAAEVLEARDLASVAYDAAKKAARLLKAKQAHDELITAAYRAQADALEIEAGAKRRLADEYDAAQERGEVRCDGERGKAVPDENSFSKPTAADVGLSRKEIHEARLIRDAEAAEPGIIRGALDEALAAGEEPTKAKVKRAALKASKRTKQKRKPRYRPAEESQHSRDLRMLLGVWEAACETARAEFLRTINN